MNPEETISQRKLLRESEVAQIIDLSVQTLRNHRSEGTGIPFCKIGRAVRYLRSDVDDFIQKCRIVPEKRG